MVSDRWCFEVTPEEGDVTASMRMLLVSLTALLVAAVCLFGGGRSAFARVPPPYPVGDADCSGTVDSLDAGEVLSFTADLLTANDRVDITACQPDANQDGRVNSIDAALILQYSAGLLAHLPP